MSSVASRTTDSAPHGSATMKPSPVAASDTINATQPERQQLKMDRKTPRPFPRSTFGSRLVQSFNQDKAGKAVHTIHAKYASETANRCNSMVSDTDAHMASGISGTVFTAANSRWMEAGRSASAPSRAFETPTVSHATPALITAPCSEGPSEQATHGHDDDSSRPRRVAGVYNRDTARRLVAPLLLPDRQAGSRAQACPANGSTGREVLPTGVSAAATAAIESGRTEETAARAAGARQRVQFVLGEEEFDDMWQVLPSPVFSAARTARDATAQHAEHDGSGDRQHVQGMHASAARRAGTPVPSQQRNLAERLFGVLHEDEDDFIEMQDHLRDPFMLAPDLFNHVRAHRYGSTSAARNADPAERSRNDGIAARDETSTGRFTLIRGPSPFTAFDDVLEGGLFVRSTADHVPRTAPRTAARTARFGAVAPWGFGGPSVGGSSVHEMVMGAMRAGLSPAVLFSDRDFTADDYEMLLKLDETVENRKGATQDDIEKLPVKVHSVFIKL